MKENRIFDKKIKLIENLWKTQKKQAELADSLLAECEEIETEMEKRLSELKERFPERFEEWLKQQGVELEKERVEKDKI